MLLKKHLLGVILTMNFMKTMAKLVEKKKEGLKNI